MPKTNRSRDVRVVYCWRCKARTVHRYDRHGTLRCVNCGAEADA
jgi:hypothetical protein